VKLIKLSQFKKETNHIANYFVLDYGNNKTPDIRPYDFFIASETFRTQLNKDNRDKKIPEFRGKIIHICYDMSANKLYFPEFDSLEELNLIKKTGIIDYIKMAIARYNPSVLATSVGEQVVGNPHQTFRIRKVANFFSATSYIKKNIYGEKNNKVLLEKIPFNPDLLVVEADLSVMPKTVAYLGVDSKIESFFEKENTRVVTFIKTISNKDYILYAAKGPFILINTSRGAQISGAEKERLVVDNYNKYIESNKITPRIEIFNSGVKDYFIKSGWLPEDINKVESGLILEVYRIEYLLSLGWSVENMCRMVINTKVIETIEDLLGAGRTGHIIFLACRELEKKGVPNPLKNYYYYIVKRSKNFPFKVDMTDNASPILQVVNYDPQMDLVVLKSKLYIREDICKKILFSDDVTIVNYITDEKLFRSTKRAGVDPKTKNSAISIVNDVKKELKLGDEVAFDFEQVKDNPTRLTKFDFDKRKISDFYQAAEKIKINCKRAQRTTGKQVDFEDLTVYTGPFGLYARGLKGGYVPPNSKTRPDGSVDVIPGELQDVKFYPRNIIIDTLESPSVADQYDAIIHEYQHDINQKIGILSLKYEMPQGGDMGKMLKYLNDANERESHITQAMILADSGLSKDQIIQRFLSEQVPDNRTLPIAEKYNEFVEEATKRLEIFYEEEKEEEKMESTLQKLRKETPAEKAIRLRNQLKN